MPDVILSDGSKLYETTQKDSRGNPVFLNDAGSLITKQGDAYVLSRPADDMTNEQLKGVLATLRDRDDEEAATLVENLSEQFKLSLPPKEAFQFPTVGQFLEESRGDALAFFKPDFELLGDKIKTTVQQAEQLRNLEIEQAAENRDVGFETEDRGFARTLDSAQSGFAGRGIADSGIRNRDIEERIEDTQAQREEIARDFRQTEERTSQGFEQFLERTELNKRENELRLRRGVEEKALSIADQRRQEELVRNEAFGSQFSDFLRQQVS